MMIPETPEDRQREKQLDHSESLLIEKGWHLVTAYVRGKRRWFACPAGITCINGEGYGSRGLAIRMLERYLTLKSTPAAVDTARQVQRAHRDLFEREFPNDA